MKSSPIRTQVYLNIYVLLLIITLNSILVQNTNLSNKAKSKFFQKQVKHGLFRRKLKCLKGYLLKNRNFHFYSDDSWSKFSRVFNNNKNSKIYGISSEGDLYKALETTKNLFKPKNLISKRGWDLYSHAFFNNGELYVVSTKGHLFKASPPKNIQDNWISRADILQFGNFANLKHVTMNGEGNDMYIVDSQGKLYRGKPPSGKDDDWFKRAELLNNAGDFKVCKFFIVIKEDKIICIKENGDALMRVAPKGKNDKWFSSAFVLDDSKFFATSTFVYLSHDELELFSDN